MEYYTETIYFPLFAEGNPGNGAAEDDVKDVNHFSHTSYFIYQLMMTVLLLLHIFYFSVNLYIYRRWRSSLLWIVSREI